MTWSVLRLCSDWLSHQLFLQVDGPDDRVVSNSEDHEEEEAQFRVTHLSHSSVVEDWLPPVRKPIHQDVIISVQAQYRHSLDTGTLHVLNTYRYRQSTNTSQILVQNRTKHSFLWNILDKNNWWRQTLEHLSVELSRKTQTWLETLSWIMTGGCGWGVERLSFDQKVGSSIPVDNPRCWTPNGPS